MKGGHRNRMVNYRKYRDQSYSDLKEKAKTSGQLFTDDLFKAENGSLFFSRSSPPFPVEWKRPKVCFIYTIAFRLNHLKISDLYCRICLLTRI